MCVKDGVWQSCVWQRQAAEEEEEEEEEEAVEVSLESFAKQRAVQ